MPAHAFENCLANAWPPESWQDVTVLVAVSGGADSTALLRALAAIRGTGEGRLIVAHFNHRLRGTESDGDAAFVKELATQLHLPCETAAAKEPQSTEEATRDDRYAFLVDAARRTGARYVAMAHTADDQAETILHRILRGTGLSGLAGMSRARALADGVSLLRPLLEFRRSELRQYLADIHQEYREDRSNLDLHFTRNRIRHELLPQLAERYNPAVREALVRLGELAHQHQAFVTQHVQPLRDSAVTCLAESVVELHVDRLSSVPRLVVRELLVTIWHEMAWSQQAMTLEHWEQLTEMASAAVLPSAGLGQTEQKRIFPGAVEAERRGGRLRLRRIG